MTQTNETTTDLRNLQERNDILAGIADSILRLEALETRLPRRIRQSDGDLSVALDFLDMSAWATRQAIMAAYDSGYDAANAQKGM